MTAFESNVGAAAVMTVVLKKCENHNTMTGILSRLLFFFGEWKKKKVGHEATIPPDVKCIAVPPFFLDLSRCAGMIETFCNIENLKKRHGRILAF